MLFTFWPSRFGTDTAEGTAPLEGQETLVVVFLELDVFFVLEVFLELDVFFALEVFLELDVFFVLEVFFELDFFMEDDGTEPSLEIDSDDDEADTEGSWALEKNELDVLDQSELTFHDTEGDAVSAISHEERKISMAENIAIFVKENDLFIIMLTFLQCKKIGKLAPQIKPV